jgi:hypothetical protein
LKEKIAPLEAELEKRRSEAETERRWRTDRDDRLDAFVEQIRRNKIETRVALAGTVIALVAAAAAWIQVLAKR